MHTKLATLALVAGVMFAGMTAFAQQQPYHGNMQGNQPSMQRQHSAVMPPGTRVSRTGLPAGAMPSRTTKIMIDNQPFQTTTPPILVHGSAYLPMREVFDKLGAQVMWKAQNHEVDATKGTQHMVLHLGSPSAMVNNRTVQLTTAPFTYQGRVYVPLRFVSEALGARVSYNQSRHEVAINTMGRQAARAGRPSMTPTAMETASPYHGPGQGQARQKAQQGVTVQGSPSAENKPNPRTMPGVQSKPSMKGQQGVMTQPGVKPIKSGLPAGAKPSPTTKITIDNQPFQTTAPPVLVNGSAFVPMREIFTKLGANVMWKGQNAEVDATKGSKHIALFLGSKSATIDSQPMHLSAAPFDYQGNVYVPLRFVSEALGGSVAYQAAQHQIAITTTGRQVAALPGAPVPVGPAPSRPSPSTAQPGVTSTMPAGARPLTNATIIVNGTSLSNTAQPMQVGNMVMVPAQPVLQQLNAQPRWSPSRQEITAIYGGQRIILTAGSRSAKVGTRTEQLVQAPFVSHNDLYIPLNFVSAAFNAVANYRPSTQQVVINTPNAPIAGAPAPGSTQPGTATGQPSTTAGLPAGARPLSGVAIVVNGHRLSTAAQPVQIGNTVMVPGQPVLQQLGLKPYWDARTQHLTASSSNGQIVLIGGDDYGTIGSRSQRLSQRPFVYQNELYIPMDFLGAALNATASYQPSQRQVLINSQGHTVAGVPPAPAPGSRPRTTAALPANARLLQGATITVGGARLSTAPPPVEIGSTVMVPGRPVLQQMGVQPYWNARTQHLTAMSRSRQIVLIGGDEYATVGSHSERLSERPFMYQNELYVPLNFIGSAFNVNARYESNLRQVVIGVPGGRQVG